MLVYRPTPNAVAEYNAKLPTQRGRLDDVTYPYGVIIGMCAAVSVVNVMVQPSFVVLQYPPPSLPVHPVRPQQTLLGPFRRGLQGQWGTSTQP